MKLMRLQNDVVVETVEVPSTVLVMVETAAEIIADGPRKRFGQGKAKKNDANDASPPMVSRASVVADFFHPDAGFVEAPDNAEIGMVMTVEGLVAAPPEPSRLMINMRATRDGILACTDMMVSVPDYPLTAQQREQLVAYRAALRELPKMISASATTVTWPQWPEGVPVPSNLREAVVKA